MLGRQWQFGEDSTGTDAGSPAAAQVIVDTAAVTRYPTGAAPAHFRQDPMPPTTLALETLVEAETSRKRLAPGGAHQLNPDGTCSACWKRPASSAPPAPSGWEAPRWPPFLKQAKQIDAASLSFIPRPDRPHL